MLADVHAKFGGRPPRSRRATRPPSWRRRRDRTPRIRAAHQSRSTTSEGLRGCPPDVGCTPDLIFPGARPSGAPVRTRHRTRRAASRDPTPFARWSGSIRIGTDWRMWPMPSPRAPAALLVRSGLSWCARHRCGKSSLISCPTSLGRTGGGLLFMDDRPSKNPPRPSVGRRCMSRLTMAPREATMGQAGETRRKASPAPGAAHFDCQRVRRRADRGRGVSLTGVGER